MIWMMNTTQKLVRGRVAPVVFRGSWHAKQDVHCALDHPSGAKYKKKVEQETFTSSKVCKCKTQSISES